MLIGHLSIAYAARKQWPRAELVLLLVATMLPDLADFVLPQGNQCRAQCGLYTHAFPAFLLLAAVAATLAWFIWHRRAAVMLAAAMVLSHIALDLLTGYKQFWVGGPVTGVVLYAHAEWDFVLECGMMIGAWWWLRRDPNAPRYATRIETLAFILVLQLAFDTMLFHQYREQRAAQQAKEHESFRAK